MTTQFVIMRSSNPVDQEKNDTGTCTRGKIPRGTVTVDIDTPMQGITRDCLFCVTPMAVSKASNQSLF